MADYQSLEKQRERLNEVLNLLKGRGIKSTAIAAKTETDTIYVSHLKSGGVKMIPDDFLDKLQDAYDINPGYIRGTSDIVFSPLCTGLRNFEAITKGWDTVSKGKHSYLHIRMDKNLYNFLVEYDNIRLAEMEGIATDSAVKDLKALHVAKPEIEEYVILPRNAFVKYVGEAKKTKQTLENVIKENLEEAQEEALEEILAVSEHIDYLDDSPENK